VYETELDEVLWENTALILDDPLAQKRILSPTPRDKSVSFMSLLARGSDSDC